MYDSEKPATEENDWHGKTTSEPHQPQPDSGGARSAFCGVESIALAGGAVVSNDSVLVRLSDPTSLVALLLGLVVAGASWAAFGMVGGVAVVAILAAVGMQLGARRPGRAMFFRLAAGALWSLALGCLMTLGIIAGRDIARGAHCRNNMKQIAVALRSYRDCYGAFPPPCTVDKAGRPMCSWRLRIKPFLDCSPMYGRWDFKEPWDSPNNTKLRAINPCEFQCPMDETASALGSTTTSYVAVVGRNLASRWNQAVFREKDDLKSQSPTTFLVIEMANSQVQWTEPKDVRFDDAETLQRLAANGPHRRNNGYFFQATPGINAILVDGDMIFPLWHDSSDNVFTALLPPNEETMPGYKNASPLDQIYREKLHPHWPHRIGLPVWLVAVGLLIGHVRARRGAACGEKQ